MFRSNKLKSKLDQHTYKVILDDMRVGQQNGSLSKLYKDWWKEAKYFNFYQFYIPVLNILLTEMTSIESYFNCFNGCFICPCDLFLPLFLLTVIVFCVLLTVS